MDKEILKSVLSSVKEEDVVDMNFVGDFRSFNGQYKIMKVSRGKGKGGSLILDVLNVATGARLSTLTMPNGKAHFLGTPVSEYIMNITAGGKLYGVQTESELPRAFPRTKEEGDALRDILKPLVGRATQTRLTIKSSKAPEFNGTWIVTSAKLNAGRHGQVSLQMVDANDPTRTRELWSYRHGAVIDEIEEEVPTV